MVRVEQATIFTRGYHVVDAHSVMVLPRQVIIVRVKLATKLTMCCWGIFSLGLYHVRVGWHSKGGAGNYAHHESLGHRCL